MKRVSAGRLRRVKVRETYTVGEMALLLGVHPRTVQSWKHDGLEPISRERRPHLFLGSEAVAFLKSRKGKRIGKLKPGEFSCMKCRIPTFSDPAKIQEVLTLCRIGKDDQQALIKGVCYRCGSALVRLSTWKIVDSFKSASMLLWQRHLGLTGNQIARINTDLNQEAENESKCK